MATVKVGHTPARGDECIDHCVQVAVVAVDPAALDPEVLALQNTRHLRLKAEEVLRGYSAEPTFADQQGRLTGDRSSSQSECDRKRRSPLEDSAREIYGINWKTKFRSVLIRVNILG